MIGWAGEPHLVVDRVRHLRVPLQCQQQEAVGGDHEEAPQRHLPEEKDKKNLVSDSPCL